MDALNHADQMRLANLISDNLDDAEIQKKLDQVVELTSSTRDQAAVALHDCHYDVGKAVDMILEGDHAIVENQWKSAGKKKNKNLSSQAAHAGAGGTKQHPSSAAGGGKSLMPGKAALHHHHTAGGTSHLSSSSSTTTTITTNNSLATTAPHHSGSSSSTNNNSHNQQSSTTTTTQQQQHNQYHNNKSNNNATALGGGIHQQPQTSLNNQFNAGNKQDAPMGPDVALGKTLASSTSSNLKSSSELQAANSSATSAAPSSALLSETLHHHHHNNNQQQHQQQHTTHPHSQHHNMQQQQAQHQQRSSRGPQQQHRQQHQQRSTRIPDSAVEMPNNELHVSSLNVQFGELDLRDGGNTGSSDIRGTFHNVLDTNTLGSGSGVAHRQTAGGLQNSHHSSSNTTTNMPQTNQDGNTTRQQQQHLAKQGGGPRRPYNSNTNSNISNDDRRFYNNSNRGGRQISSGNQRPYSNQRGPGGPMGPGGSGGNSRGVRTILNRGLQPNSNLPGSVSGGPSSQPNNSGFPNSIDTWTNSTAEAVSKKSNPDQAVGSLRVGQWSDVAGTEDWSEEDWEAKVMETKVFTPSTKSVDGPVSNQKIQPLLTDSSVSTQINLASKLSESVRDDASSQQNTLNTVTSQSQSQQSSQKPLSHMNDIFDTSVAKAVLEQQNLASMKPKSSISRVQYNKDSADAKTVLDQQNLNSIKPKTTMTMNQYSKEASESLKSLVGISSTTKGNVPSVPPGALPIMSQPQYIMGNAYQPAIFPYAYQTPDVHYQVAAQTTGREQNFQSVYSPNDANKFNRGTDGDTPAINTTQAAPVASQTHNQAFVANALHAGYQLTYAMPGAFNMMPQNLYSAAPIFPHIPQPTNTGSANTVYQKNTATSYQHHSGYSGYDQLNPLIQDYVKQQQQQQNYPPAGMQHQQQQPTSKASASNSELDVISEGNSYNMYGSMNKSQPQVNKQANYNESKGYQQQMSNNGPQQQFGLSHNAQQPSSIANYPLLQAHNLDGSSLNSQNSAQHQLQQLQQHANARSGTQVNPSKYYPNWN